MSEEMLDQLVTRWRSLGIEILPGASRSAIEQLERETALRWPLSFQEYLTVVNGMPEGIWDDRMIHFWNIREMIAHTKEAAFARYRFIPFADYSANCWAWVLSIEDDERVGDAVFTYGPPLAPCTVNFNLFLSRYLLQEQLSPSTLAPRTRPHWKGE